MPTTRTLQRMVSAILLLLVPFSLSARTQTAPKATTFTFPLPDAQAESALTMAPGKQEVKFRKEPTFGNSKVIRRSLKVGPGKDDFLGYAVDFSNRTLYLDLNQNLDLTDDPQGIFKGLGNIRSAMFRDVAFIVRKNGIERRFRINFFLNDQDAFSSLSILLSHKGEIELEGKKWILEIQDNLDGVWDQKDRFLLRPVGLKSEEAFSSGFMPVSRRLFLAGHLYNIEFKFEAGSGPAALLAAFTEVSSPMAELNLDGESIQLLILRSDSGIALLDSPAHRVSLPVDRYRIHSMDVRSFQRTFKLANANVIPEFTPVAGAPFHLKAGGPLTSSATAEAFGSMLNLSYVLKGIGGEVYTVTDTNRSQPPKWSVYKGNRLLAAGSFEFG
jgi:hypothetical protein